MCVLSVMFNFVPTSKPRRSSLVRGARIIHCDRCADSGFYLYNNTRYVLKWQKVVPHRKGACARSLECFLPEDI